MRIKYWIVRGLLLCKVTIYKKKIIKNSYPENKLIIYIYANSKSYNHKKESPTHNKW